ncbi:MAG: hypothetical protein CMB80_03335 [Flammeovirgaceae bacterium]|nr:hypothetical protein [Flammeovirgaceae bacterium]
MDINKIIEADGNIYRTDFPDANISMSYRLLSLREYKVFKSLRDGGILPPFVISEMAFDRCYLGNTSLINIDMPAGITVSIGDLIMYLSGDCDEETLVADISIARQLHPPDTVFEYMRSAVITAFPTYTIDNLDNLTRTQFLRYFAIAENVLTKQNEEYKRLNLKEIKTAGEMTSKPNHDIDFNKDNREISKAVGHWNSEEANDKYREEQKARTPPPDKPKRKSHIERKPLTKDQLSRLDSRRR